MKGITICVTDLKPGGNAPARLPVKANRMMRIRTSMDLMCWTVNLMSVRKLAFFPHRLEVQDVQSRCFRTSGIAYYLLSRERNIHLLPVRSKTDFWLLHLANPTGSTGVK